MDLQPKEPFANALQQVDVVRSERTLFYNVCYSRLIAILMAHSLDVINIIIMRFLTNTSRGLGHDVTDIDVVAGAYHLTITTTLGLCPGLSVTLGS